MKCPLFRAANIARGFISIWDGDNCLREECVWWDKVGKSCVVQTIGYMIGTLCDMKTEGKHDNRD